MRTAFAKRVKSAHTQSKEAKMSEEEYDEEKLWIDEQEIDDELHEEEE